MSRKTWQQITTRFTDYVQKYHYYLRTTHPEALRLLDDVFTDEEITKFPVITNQRMSFNKYLEDLVEMLEITLTKRNEFEQTRALHYVFNQLNDFFTQSGVYQSPLTNVIGDERNTFLKPQKFWKDDSGSPIGFSKSFQTFGPYHKEFPAKIIRLDELADKISLDTGIANNFSVKEQLNIGLFPLSKEFIRSFKITKILNRNIPSYGFKTDELLHENYKKEIDVIIDIIKTNGMDIAVFPELLISDEILEYFKGKIASLGKDFFMIVAGSDHRLTDEKLKNTIPVVIYFSQYEQTVTYSKLDTFNVPVREDNIKLLRKLMINAGEKFPKDEDFLNAYLEEDVVVDTNLLILSSFKFGDIGFVICKDFLPDSSDLIRNYTRLTDHLFVVSLNFSDKADFKERGNHLALEHGMSVFYVNALSFDTGFKSPSFFVIPKEGEKPSFEFIEKGQYYLVYKLNQRGLPPLVDLNKK